MNATNATIVDDGKETKFWVEMQHRYFNKPLTGFEKQVLKLIPKDHKVTQGDIARLLGITERRVRDTVLMLIKKGVPVCGDPNNQCPGYHLAQSKAELNAEIAKNRHRCEEAFARMAGLANSNLDNWK